MSEQADRLATSCPSCAPAEETVHEVLSGGGGSLTVRCGECGHVHKVQPERERTETVDVVVSQDGESFTANVETPAEETIEVGDEFLLDTEEALLTVRVTSVEVGEERRPDAAVASDVETVWTRAVDNVSVNVTVHPRDGSRDDSRSVTMYVPGDYELTVGEEEEAEEERFEIDAVVVRGDADGYDHDRYDHEGDVVLAKDAKRVYAWDRSSRAWSAW